MSSQTEWAATPEAGDSGRLSARRALWAPAVFVVWTVVVWIVGGLLTRWFGEPVPPGEAASVQEWLPWAALTVLWILPLLGGLALAGHALARAAGRAGWIALGVNAGALVLVLVPAFVDRIGPPTL